MNSDQGHEGGCACGRVCLLTREWSAEGGNLCHCMTCRRIHGAPFGVYAIFPRDAVEVTGATRAWASSAMGRRHHCPHCVSPVYLAFDGLDEIEVPTGVFDEIGLYPPEYEIWCRSAEPWHDAQGRPRHAEARAE